MIYNLPLQEGMGIGSLPYKDPHQSINLIRSHLSTFPHWPQQPSLGEGARIISQFTYPLEKMGLVKRREGKYWFCTSDNDWNEKLTDYYQIYLAIEAGDTDLLEDYFALPKEYFPGFYLFLAEEKKGIKAVKGQVSGPLTVGLSVKDEEGRDSFYHEDLRDIILKSIALEAIWQIKHLHQFSVPILISIDDPGIYACGSSAYICINRKQVLSSLRILSSMIQEQGAHVGLHSCAGIDWSLPLQSNIQVLSFDAYSYFHTIIGYIEELNSFLKSGGILAWGMVPTSQEAYSNTGENLLKVLMKNQETLIRRGADRERLKKQLLITPSCGCGTLEEPLAEKIYSLTGELVRLYQESR